ncbi:16S rRNA (guanine(966)-N(2))-methyltransferase RsmD [Pelotomaculum schinkii]|uniref:16S rRNA (guanine(966)-N(2))-methyltransferase RsmD n=1 Tax=Pelotomaculum schinkii TaxID=78350 RepID=UPI001FA97FC5|nr:16S rRNA (guanine(966)-N(2))-methyltransferase RsmD [Pelotomaculum schinkii]
MISGSARNRKLKVPGGLTVRPTADRVKEALFNILREHVPGCCFLDLFAGSGSIGIEALSRGASVAVFVEANHRHAAIIKENLKACGLEPSARLITAKVTEALHLLAREGQAFDLVFLDPPYLKSLEAVTLADIDRYHLLKPGGMVIVESSKRDCLPQSVDGLRLLRAEKYGDTILSFFRR